MKFLPALIAGAALALAPLTPASADTPGCVSKYEFSLVKPGWTKFRVNRLYDTKGSEVFVMKGFKSYEYPVCRSEWGVSYVDYEFKDGYWRVASKYAYWGDGTESGEMGW